MLIICRRGAVYLCTPCCAGEILMTANGWLQICFLLLVVLLSPSRWSVHGAGFRREPDLAGPGDAASGTHSLPAYGRGRKPRDGLEEYALALILSAAFHDPVVCAAAVQQWAWLPWNRRSWRVYLRRWHLILRLRLPQIRIGRIIARVHHELSNADGGLAYHNWVSAAAGMALAIAFIRGISRREQKTIGNFWVDLVRGTLWILAPLCLVGALLLCRRAGAEPKSLMTRCSGRSVSDAATWFGWQAGKRTGRQAAHADGDATGDRTRANRLAGDY